MTEWWWSLSDLMRMLIVDAVLFSVAFASILVAIFENDIRRAWRQLRKR